MTVLVPLARVLSSGLFLMAGSNTFKNPAPAAGLASGFLGKVREVAPVPLTDEQLVKVNAGVQVGAGAALAVGKFPRLAPALLVGSLVPTTVAGHAFWETEAPADKKAQRLQFVKNTSVIGGLLFAMAVGGQQRKIGRLKKKADTA